MVDDVVTWDDPGPDPGDLARRLCDRRRGVGADGLLVGIPVEATATGAAATDPGAIDVTGEGVDARMVLFNSDGSRAEMSGNGIRCFAQALARRLGERRALRILTDAGIRTVRLAATEDPATVTDGFTRYPKGQGPQCCEVCPREAVIYGKRDELLTEAKNRIAGKYLDSPAFHDIFEN